MKTITAATTRARLLTAVRIVPVTMVLASTLLGATVASAAGADTDQDGLFDQDEISIYLTNPNLADTDADSFDDGEEIYSQSDPLNATSLPGPQADFDGDGLFDLDEAQYYLTDPAVADTDGDGMSDGEEIYLGADPLTAVGMEAQAMPVDSDADGLSDDDETNIWRTSAFNADSDSDGYGDGFEVANTMNPLVADLNDGMKG